MNKKRILLIGGSSSIGCEVIKQIDEEGVTFLAHYHSRRDQLDAIRSQIKAEIVPVKADLSVKEGAMALVDSAISLYEHPDKIVFLAAPSITLTRFKDLEWADFSRQMDMQLYSAYAILQKFLPMMATIKYGKIVFVLSSYTIGIPPASLAHYVTAKYAMLGFMKALASEYASKSICINSVSPTMIETDFLSQIPKKVVEFSAQQHPLKRNGLPTDVAPVVKFLLSDEAAYLTGINIPITGGG